MLSRIIIISLFCLLIVVIGIIGMRKTRSFNDYFLGGGKIGAWMTAFTYGTAYFSAVLFIGFAGQVGWNFGYSGLWIAVFNSLVGVLGVWWLMGHRIKKMSVEYKVSTLPEYLEKRYNSKALKLYSSIAIFLLFIPYSAAVFIGLSYLFKVTFNIDYTVALLFMGGFTGLYLVLGGYNSMTMIDVIFGAIMILGCIVLASATISAAGGLNELTSKLAAIDPKLVSQVGPAGFWNLFYLVFLTSVAPFAMPQLIQKFYAVRDKKAIRLGMVASTSFSLLIAVVAYFVGSTSRVFLTPENAPAAFSNGKPVYDSLMPELLNKVIPEYLFVIMLLLILSASMSTLAAIILISSSSVVKDFYSGFINKNASDNMLTNLMRVCALVFIIISVVLAYFKPASIVIILGISWGAIGAAFLGPFVWGLLWKRTSLSGAFISSVIGLGTCLVLYFTGSSSPQAGTIGMLLSFILCPLI
ncbi:MAG TPA: sodium/solute symporter, partial [Ignavibacteria bacterium]|nr:sodium/solute symporter [Ignavibacteria bacterium]